MTHLNKKQLNNLVFYAGEETEANSTWPLLSVLKEMVNVELLLNPTFLLVGASNVFGMLGFYVPFVYLPNMAALRGVSVEDANFLLSVIGTVFFYAVSEAPRNPQLRRIE